MLRREESGGLIFNKTGLTSYLCNHSAFAIFEYFDNMDRWSKSDLLGLSTYIKNIFAEVPEEVEPILTKFICGCVNHRFLELVEE